MGYHEGVRLRGGGGQGTARRRTGKCHRIQRDTQTILPIHSTQNPPPSPGSRSSAATRPRPGLRVWHGSGCAPSLVFGRVRTRVAGDVDPIDGARRIRGWRCGRQEFGWLTPGRRSSVLPSLLASLAQDGSNATIPTAECRSRSSSKAGAVCSMSFRAAPSLPTEILVPTATNVFQDHLVSERFQELDRRQAEVGVVEARKAVGHQNHTGLCG